MQFGTYLTGVFMPLISAATSRICGVNMSETTPIVLVPGLASSSRIWLPVMPVLWTFGPVTVVNHSRDYQMAAIAKRILKDAPPRFALAGHSMGGYIAFEIMRQAPERVIKLALMNTQARVDTPEVAARRRDYVAKAKDGKLQEVMDASFPLLVHPARIDDAMLKRLKTDMANDTGVQGYVNNQTAMLSRPDSLPTLTAIRCPTMVLSSDQDLLISNERSKEMAENIRDASLVIVPDCGHLSQAEQPEAVSAAMADWMRM